MLISATLDIRPKALALRLKGPQLKAGDDYQPSPYSGYKRRAVTRRGRINNGCAVGVMVNMGKQIS